MAQLGCPSNDNLGNPKVEIRASGYEDEHDRLPLKLRLKTLLTRRHLSDTKAATNRVCENGSNTASMSHVDSIVKNEDVLSDLQGDFVLDVFTSGSTREQAPPDIVLGGFNFEAPVCNMSLDAGTNSPSCLQNASSSQYGGKSGSLKLDETPVNLSFCSNQISCGEVDAHVGRVDEAIIGVGNYPENSIPTNVPAEVKFEHCDNNLMSSVAEGISGCVGSDIQAVQLKSVIHDEFLDDLDRMSLRERQRLLLSSKLLGSMKPLFKENSECLSSQIIECHVGTRARESLSVSGINHMAGNPSHSIPEEIASTLSQTSRSSISGGSLSDPSCITPQSSSSVGLCHGTEYNKSGNCRGIKQRFQIRSSKKPPTNINPRGSPASVPANPVSTHLDSSISSKVKNEPPDCYDLSIEESTAPANLTNSVGACGSLQKSSHGKIANVNVSCNTEECVPAMPYCSCSPAPSACAQAKGEPSDHQDLNNIKEQDWRFSSNGLLPLKSDLQSEDRTLEDPIDHKPLLERIQLLNSGNVSIKNFPNNHEHWANVVPCVVDSRPIHTESVRPVCSKLPRKRKKTATDSAETALEEDAPGLLKALVDKGISLDEIKLYGLMENEDKFDDSLEDSFSELEDVISKIFWKRESFIKFGPLRCTKGVKESYCLGCLVSLVEQSRYLRFRKWPAEWGWCRDLQSFIFVFERHNRIVLERPEYGYATYFFEIADTLPLDWQVRRLVTAMKLTHCSRVTLIENKVLVAGKDLSEGEAKVMMEYGWTPNTSLARMLNYCDRVYHDRKNEEGTEWRTKIGKLLMDGYNGGVLVSTDIPKKVIERSTEFSPQIKLELL